MKENKNKMNFIRTSDLETRNKLLSLGFTEITEMSSHDYCFINNGKLVFDNKDNKCVYTNIMCL